MQLGKITSTKSVLFFLLVIIFLSSCGNPTINILLSSTKDSNEVNAVQLKIFQLKSSEKFKLATRESLLRNSAESLGEDLIPNSKIEKIMVPGEVYNYENLEISEETKFIGFVCDFFLPAEDGWSRLIDLSEGNDEIKILIGKNFISTIE